MSQEAQASSRKATGTHNRLDRAERAERPTRKGADVGQGTKRLMVVNAGQRRRKLDTALWGCKQTRRERKLSPASRPRERAWPGSRVLRNG